MFDKKEVREAASLIANDLQQNKANRSVLQSAGVMIANQLDIESRGIPVLEAIYEGWAHQQAFLLSDMMGRHKELGRLENNENLAIADYKGTIWYSNNISSMLIHDGNTINDVDAFAYYIDNTSRRMSIFTIQSGAYGNTYYLFDRIRMNMEQGIMTSNNRMKIIYNKELGSMFSNGIDLDKYRLQTMAFETAKTVDNLLNRKK
jgi:hypothetical protein